MSYLDDILKRADLYQFTSFLLYGGEVSAPLQEYRQWRKTAHDDMSAALRLHISDPDELERIYNLISVYVGTSESDALEVGIKAGARFMLELLQTKPPEPSIT